MGAAKRRSSGEESLFTPPASAQPLAARIRPRTLDELVGQHHLLDPGKPLREAIERGAITSMVFWGPPGSGKTTIGRLIAHYTDREFVPFSAVTEGVGRVREIIAAAEERLELGRQTVLFVDEIHRFNKAQQDAFLPRVEVNTLDLRTTVPHSARRRPGWARGGDPPARSARTKGRVRPIIGPVGSELRRGPGNVRGNAV